MIEVMLVEDSDIARAVLRDLLNEIDDVMIAGEFCSSSDAIAEIRVAAPDVILLDIQLNNGSGMNVLQFVTSEYPKIKVIIVTNHAEKIFRAHYASAGAYAFFDKSRELGPLRRTLVQLALSGVGT